MEAFTCLCCGETAEIESEEEFDRLDWERIPAREAIRNNPATVEKIFCNLCPAFYTSDLAIEDHSRIHEHWADWGRPEKFSKDSCLLEEDKEEVVRIEELGAKVFNEIPLSEKKLVSSALRAVYYNDTDARKRLRRWEEKVETSIWV